MGAKMVRISLLAGLCAVLTLALAGCASGQRGKGAVLEPGTMSVSTNSGMPVLRVEAFRSEEKKP